MRQPGNSQVLAFLSFIGCSAPSSLPHHILQLNVKFICPLSTPPPPRLPITRRFLTSLTSTLGEPLTLRSWGRSSGVLGGKISFQFYRNSIGLFPNLSMTFKCRLNPSDAEVDQIQKEIDADGNGEIDFEEFLSIMKSDLLRWASQRINLDLNLFFKKSVFPSIHPSIIERCSWWTTESAVSGQLLRRLRAKIGKSGGITSFAFLW